MSDRENIKKAWELLDILRRQADTLSDRVMKLEEQRERHIRLIYDLERRVDALEHPAESSTDGNDGR